MPKLTDGEIVARTLTNYGVKYAAGIPGHGLWGLLDGFHEQNYTQGSRMEHETTAPVNLDHGAHGG